ncbi:MAG: exodeoxyribonuclease VII large subunit [Chloroflexi bacterium]|nr:exodeoxyribonuclease VII large subunit [Chloroflexota bacterium]
MPIYTVTQVAGYIKTLLDTDDHLAELWVSGEVSNVTKAASGHCYFTLKDTGGQIRCVMFRNGVGSQHLAHGAQVVAHGRVSLYPQRGDLQFYVDVAQPEGVGQLHLELELLKLKLQQEGLFEPSRKRALPPFPKRIAVVTSPTGAVFHDICTVLERRYPLVEVLLAPAQVQGDNAAPTIVHAFQELNRRDDIDLVIVARGGGSLEELWPFNTEQVARAIYASRAPVVSAVGHQTDVTIADMVADLRAPTPSAAAELAAPDQEQVRASILGAVRSVTGALERALSDRAEDVRSAGLRLGQLMPDIASHRQEVDESLRTIASSCKTQLALVRERVNGSRQRLLTLEPAKTLARGYAVVQKRPGGELVTGINQVSVGDGIKVSLHDGAFEGEVTEKG